MHRPSVAACALLVALLSLVGACRHEPEQVASPQLYQAQQASAQQGYEHKETRDLAALVDDAAALVQSRGDGAFADLRVPGSRWRRGESYVFVLDTHGTMLVHPDPALEGKNDIDLKDVAGKPIIRGLIEAATVPGRPAGWYHYEWPVPGGILPRWKSSYVRLVTTPLGQRYIVGAGMYDDRMERPFVVDLVRDAVARIERDGAAAFPALRDKKGPFIAKDAYVFVIAPDGVELVNPTFPNLEGGPSLVDFKDTNGKKAIKEMIDVASSRGGGWVDYMWPKPGESVATQKSVYVTKARLGAGPSWVVVGAGVYLADAPRSAPVAKMTAPELVTLVREGAQVFQQRGESAFPQFREKGTKWFHDDIFFFVWTLDGKRVFFAADPSIEGRDVHDMKGAKGRPVGQMVVDIGKSPSGEGWVHFMTPRPGSLFPEWKSSFVKRVTFPSGTPYIVGAGVFDMKMDPAFIEDTVRRASALVAAQGKAAFPELRDEMGPFVFLDTYVFVDTPDGVEVVNPAQPTLEGRSLVNLTDAKGKYVARDYIREALEKGSAWVEYEWFKPGRNAPAHKRAFVQKVQAGPETYVVGAGYYVEP